MSKKLSQLQAATLQALGFELVTEFGEQTYQKKVRYSKLPQDDIEDVMNEYDDILSKELVTVIIFVNDGSMAIEKDDVYVGPLDATSDLAEKILVSCA
jgi:hypothetical protein